MNSNISSLHLDILDSARQNLLKTVQPYLDGFVLGGGTGLALQIAHRKSFDFDFFSKQEITKNFLEKLSETIEIDTIAVDTINELTFFTKDMIKITFLYYPFPTAHTILEKNKLHIFSIQDIAYQKAYTIGRRGEYRDYFDLFSILSKNYCTFDELITTTKHLYQGVFDEKLFLEQLTYFDDLLNFDIIPLHSNYPQPNEVKQFFIDLVRSFIEK